MKASTYFFLYFGLYFPYKNNLFISFTPNFSQVIFNLILWKVALMVVINFNALADGKQWQMFMGITCWTLLWASSGMDAFVYFCMFSGNVTSAWRATFPQMYADLNPSGSGDQIGMPAWCLDSVCQSGLYVHVSKLWWIVLSCFSRGSAPVLSLQTMAFCISSHRASLLHCVSHLHPPLSSSASGTP